MRPVRRAHRSHQIPMPPARALQMLSSSQRYGKKIDRPMPVWICRLFLALTLASGVIAISSSASAQGTLPAESNENEGLTEPTATAEGEEPEGEEPAVRSPTATPASGGVPAVPAAPQTTPPPATVSDRERICDDGRDDDADGNADCGDADCFDHPLCQFGGAEERNDQRCSDWVDNDGDGLLDCEDPDCQAPGLTVCHGSAPESDSRLQTEEDIPSLSGNMSVENLIGRGDDANGERNDYQCSDGVDNDGDGRIDCADFGCRFDPQVSVCTGSPGFRFSVVAGIAASYDLQADTDFETAADVEFERLQVRVLGPIPYISNSFFLLSLQLEDSVRLTFANFQVPIGDRGHYLSVNSGSGGLSTGFIISQAKLPLLDRTFYMLNAFEQGNGAQVEQGGPLIPSGRLNYRFFAAGGKGVFTGNVGGRRTEGATENFAWAVGLQLGIDFVGHFNRFDSAMLYTPVPMTVAMLIGGKYDQQATERYPAANALFVFQHSYVAIRAENYFKYAIDYGGSIQNAFNIQASILLWPEHLLLAADFGMFMADPFDQALIPADIDIRERQDELQARVALHWYWYRNIGLLALLYRERHLLEDDGDDIDDELERELRLEVQFRF